MYSCTTLHNVTNETFGSTQDRLFKRDWRTLDCNNAANVTTKPTTKRQATMRLNSCSADKQKFLAIYSIRHSQSKHSFRANGQGLTNYKSRKTFWFSASTHPIVKVKQVNFGKTGR